MAEVQESLSHLSDADLRAIAVYLKSLPPQPSQDVVTNARLIEMQKRQSILYLENCAGCHHPLGVGRKDRVPPLRGSSALRGTPANILNVVLFGIPARNQLEGMPAFADRLSDEDIARVVNYVRTKWGDANRSALTADEVKERRARGP